MDVKSSSYDTELDGCEVRIYEQQELRIKATCRHGHKIYLHVTANQLLELSRQAKIFNDRRTTYKAKHD